MPSRIDHLQNLPITICKSALAIGGTGIGVAASALSCATFGKIKFINEVAENFASAYSLSIVTPIYINILRIINPITPMHYSDINWHGIITKNITSPIFDFASDALHMDVFFVRHVVSRVAFAVGIMASVATRTTDFALGLLAALLSIATFGTIRKINSFAQNQLYSTLMISDVCLGIRGIINPQQFENNSGYLFSLQTGQCVFRHDV